MKQKTFKKESDYQSYLKKKIYSMLPGCIVTKQDPNDIQGIPDLSIFYKGRYAWLEVKKSYADYLKEFTPNQEYYIEWCKNSGTFASFIYPENEEDVLNEMARSFGY